MNREAIWSALFARAQAIAGVQTASRALRSWADVAPNEQPAVFLQQGGETATSVRGVPTKWSWQGTLYVYAHSESRGGILGDSQLNALLDAIEAAIFAPDRDGAATLGGLVSHIGIQGDVQRSEGALGNQAVAIVPFIIVPNC